MTEKPTYNELVKMVRGLEEELAESRQREDWLSTFINSSPNLAFLKDEEYRHVLVNKPYMAFLGMREEEIIGKTDFELLPDELAAQCRQSDQLARESGEIQIVHEKSGQQYFESHKFPVRLANNKTGVGGIVINVTERKIAEDEKSKLQKQLQLSQKMESIGTLAGGIAHDFNNILGIILGNAELAVDDVGEWNPARQNLKEIKTASLRAKNLVKQLLNFSRKTDSKRKPVKISPIIEDFFRLLKPLIPTNIDIQKEIFDESAVVLADPTQIHQIMLNLCTNAIHAMSENGGIIDVGLSSVYIGEDDAAQHIELNQGHYVKFTIGDTGHGIAKENLERVFDPYFTTREVGQGSGIGLSVVHGIIKSHDGAISIDSEHGKGTKIKVFLPLLENEPADDPKNRKELPTGAERILIVDDESSMANMIGQMLERLGYTVTVHTSSEDALDVFQIRSDDFDLVITDMTMPEITGDRLAKELRNIRSDIPVILCTGFSEQMNEEKAAEIGIQALIMKPIVKQELAETVRNVLDQDV
ncbi:MAG: response regulator [Desulfobacterales bacterium]|nr:response regulator [Desulfobacterales bacterium]